MPFVVPSWLGECVPLAAGTTAEDIARDLVSVGLEEEGIREPQVTGPLVVGRVLSAVPEEQSNGKTIHYCRVDVGEHNDPAGGDVPASRGIVCGAHNFGAGDWVVVALPGAVLPGDFAIAARKTYGHVSDGMICSARELRLGDDHTGIIVLTRAGFVESELAPGADAMSLLGLEERVLEITVTPDRGYCFSMRGVAREYSHATGAPFTDPAARVTVAAPGPDGFPVEIDDAAPVRGNVGCDRFVARVVRGCDASRPSPAWMHTRLRQSGMRPISLAVDVTNYVMLELGQPLHAYDAAQVAAPIVVRRAAAGETLTTLDGQERPLDPEDLVITDSPDGRRGSRILGLAGVMGGASSEVGPATTDLVIEGAHFDPVTVARTSRRHKLSSESSKRFERGVDTTMPAVAVQRVVDLLLEYGGGEADGAPTDVNAVPDREAIAMPSGFPDAIVGVDYGPKAVREALEAIGCVVSVKGAQMLVTPPTWRPDLRAPIDLVEEVARLHGYGDLPSVLPVAPAGRGLTHGQRARRAVARSLAERGLVEVLTYPFISEERLDEQLVKPDCDRRRLVRLANPLSDEKPFLRSWLLATVVDAARVNVGRGAADVAIFEIGKIFRTSGEGIAPSVPVVARPTDDELAALDAALAWEERRVAGILLGAREPAGWQGGPTPFGWVDAVGAALAACRAAGVAASAAQGNHEPWHPGRCAAISVAGEVVGYAGELHPRACENLGLPPRSCAFELSLDAIIAAGDGARIRAVPVRTPPAAREDFAFVVDSALPAGDLVSTVRDAAGDLLEEAKVFDVYAGEQVGEGKKSIAVAVALRAADRTLTAEEILDVRTAIVAAAAATHGATLRA